MKQLFFYLSIALVLTGCKKDEKKPQLSADAEITQKVNQLYSVYGKSSEALYKVPFSDSIFSPTLKQNLENAIKISEKSIATTPKNEKPRIFEGSMFTSLYEGYTSYKIKSIEAMESTEPIGDAADVTIEFENSTVAPKMKWTDKVHLVKTFDTEFKIDNIQYGKLGNNKDLKSNLQNYITETSK